MVGMKNLEDSKPCFTKNWLNEKKHFEKLASEVSMREFRKCELTNSLAKIEIKSRCFTGAHFTNTGVAGKYELFERFKRIPRCRITTFPVEWQSFQDEQSMRNVLAVDVQKSIRF